MRLVKQTCSLGQPDPSVESGRAKDGETKQKHATRVLQRIVQLNVVDLPPESCHVQGNLQQRKFVFA